MEEYIISQDFEGKLGQLTKLMKSWSLIPENDKSGLNWFVTELLRDLYPGKSEIFIESKIESVLCVRFGMFNTDFDAGKLAKEVMNWMER